MTLGFDSVLLAANPMADGVPEWIHLVPAGKLETIDGRNGFQWDGRALQLMGIDGEPGVSRAPVDVNHANAKLGGNGHDTPAKGWIVALENRADGVWGRVEWNTAGKALIADKAYRGISAELMVRKLDGLIIGIRGASLTNTPNLKGLTPLFNAAETNPPEKKPMDAL
jgi:phage I-like protein